MRRVTVKEQSAGLVAGLALIGGAAVALAGPAFAAGAPSNAAPPPSSSLPPSVGPVVASVTIQPSGGTVTVPLPNGGSASFVVPSGEFTVPVQVEITEGNASSVGSVAGAGSTSKLVFGISFLENGSVIGGTFKSPITFTFKSPDIAPGDELFEQDPNGTWTQVTSATVTSGSVTATIDADPNFDVVQPATAVTTSTVPQATTPVTGVPVLGESLLAGGLVVLGGLGLWRLRSTRVRTTGS